MATNWMFGISIFVFLAIITSLTVIVSGDIALSTTNISISDSIDQAYNEASILEKPVLFLVKNVFDNASDDVIENNGFLDFVATAAVGFASLPVWLNALLALLWFIMIVTLIVSIVPTVGS